MKKIKEFQSKISELYSPRINDQTAAQFSQLIVFIDSALAASFKEVGDDRAQSLVTSLLNIRDFLSTNIRENSLRQHLLGEANRIINELEKSQKNTKKKEDQDQIKLSQEVE